MPPVASYVLGAAVASGVAGASAYAAYRVGVHAGDGATGRAVGWGAAGVVALFVLVLLINRLQVLERILGIL